MERINSILSLVSRTGAKVGVLRHTTTLKNFNSVTCAGHHHHHSARDIKNKGKILWVLMDEGEKSGEETFPWEMDNQHQPEENDLKHKLKIDLKVHGDINDLMEHGDRNKYLSADWTTKGHSTHWNLSVMWDKEKRNPVDMEE